MSEEARLREPERLVCDPELGPLLERANVEYGAGLDEAAAFRKLWERLTPPAPRRGRWWRSGGGALLAAAAGALAIAGAVSVVLERSASPIVQLGPEVARASGQAGAPGAAPAAEKRESGGREESAMGPAAQRAALPAAARAPAKKERAQPFEAPAPRGKPLAADAEAAVSAPRGEAREDCLALARQGQARAAEHCFGERAAGSGLSAEMALYEVARLRRDVLRDAAGALAALGEYRERFPRGSLRNEVDLSRVELLAELGRGREALHESAALLASASGRERAAELHVLRGNVYRRDLGDLHAAAEEYALAEARGGPRGAEATRLRAACLEALGDVAGALQAYRRYTSVPGQPHGAEVSRNIERLSANARERGTSP